MTKKRILYYCQHSLGMGHLVRSMEIVHALKDFEVWFLNGGEMVEGIGIPPFVEVISLPPIMSDAEFKGLYALRTSRSLDEIKEARKQCLVSEFERIQPHLVIVELFPFGRKKFAFELVPLLEQIHRTACHAKVVCSLRDILVRKQDQVQYEERVIKLMNRYFDLLLVHSDPNFQALDETFSRVGDLTCQIRYTGFVAQSSERQTPALVEGQEWNKIDEPLILVSIGGGRVGYEFVKCVLEAGTILEVTMPHRMLVFTGPYMSDESFVNLQGIVKDRPNVILQRYTTRFISYMKKADLSLSMAGYNTCMNILTTGVRALVFPFAGGGDEEQTIRARKLENEGILTVLHSDDLSPHDLAGRMKRSLTTPSIHRKTEIDVHGAEKSAAFLAELVSNDDSVQQPKVFLSKRNDIIGKTVSTWRTELRQCLDRHQSSEKEIRIFFRDDDVDENEGTLQDLLTIFLNQGVPLNLEIIPGTLTTSTITFLRRQIRVSPDLLELNQHGWLHVNREREGRKCEFGISRGFHEQYEDISRGKARLEEAFGDRFFPVFTPPWNRCTSDTLRVLDVLGFSVLSKDHDKQLVTGYGFQEFSTTLDLYRWKEGATRKSPERIISELIAQVETLSPIGILLHHKVMDGPALSFLDEFLKELVQSPIVRFYTFQNLTCSFERTPSVQGLS